MPNPSDQKNAIIKKYALTPAGWDKLADSMIRPLRMRVDYRSFVGRLVWGTPKEDAPVHYQKLIRTVLPTSKAIEKVMTELVELWSRNLAESFVFPLCQNPRSITKKELKQVFEESAAGNLLMNGSTFARLRKKYQLKEIPFNWLISGNRRDLGVRQSYFSGLIPPNVILNFTLERGDTGGFMMPATADRPLIKVLGTREAKDGRLEADLELEVDWKFDTDLQGFEALLID